MVGVDFGVRCEASLNNVKVEGILVYRGEIPYPSPLFFSKKNKIQRFLAAAGRPLPLLSGVFSIMRVGTLGWQPAANFATQHTLPQLKYAHSQVAVNASSMQLPVAKENRAEEAIQE